MTLIRSSNCISDLMRFCKQDLFRKVKRKNMTCKLWEFSTKSAFRCSQRWWNRQWLFPHTLLTFLYPHAGCWFSVSLSSSPSGLSNRSWHDIFSVPDILCVSYLYYSSKHVDPWATELYLYLFNTFNTFMWNFFMVLMYGGGCVPRSNKQCVEECVCFLPHIKNVLFPRQWKRWSASLAYSGSWPLRSPPTSLLHCRRLSLMCQHKRTAKAHFNQHLLQWAPRLFGMKCHS